jgi:Methylase involved in ubiquinone/menaquinone biosynthesis
MVSQKFIDLFYDRKKGWVDGTAHFVNLLKKYCELGAVVMDLGAGSGEGKPYFYSLKDSAGFSVGLDVDSDIYKNSTVDFRVLGSAYLMPFKQNTFDLIYADFVLEHIDNPDVFMEEIRRVLKSGGYLIFRTPNSYHYVPLIARVTPSRFKSVVANFVRSIDIEQKTFPVKYKLNTPGCLENIAKRNDFEIEHLELVEKEPSYLVFNTFAFFAGVLYERVVNSTEMFKLLRSNIFGVLKKV